MNELTHSITADNHQIDNTPSDDVAENLRILAKEILQPIRDCVGQPIIITSGYRCDKLNELVGGVKNSYHRTGQAADIHCKDEAAANYLAGIANSCRLCDMALIEKRGRRWWLHVQWSYAPRHRLAHDIR